eukprot:TRINITY_DN15957_c0_g1_i1.p1 TRINITY_DN15957_c0_g1~~TRINITY_DN15957_c0_g1_i1.p1  ORF type:complete len:730 (-),score=71.37 TRINITY_DN15957_c0_g1_i1:364-2502(-)
MAADDDTFHAHVGLASLLIRKAYTNEPVDPVGLIGRSRSPLVMRRMLWASKIRASLRMRTLRYVAVGALQLLTFTETLPWCDPSLAGNPSCDDDHYHTFGWNVLSCSTALLLESIIVSFLLVDACLWFTVLGADFWHQRWRIIHVSVLIGIVIDMIVASLRLPQCAWRTSPYLRVVLIVSYSPFAQQEMMSLMLSTYEFVKVLLLTEVFVFIWAWVGVIIFPNGTAGGEYFETIGTAVWSLHLLLNGNSWPDMLLPGYSQHRAVLLYFIGFILIGVILLLQMTTAAVYDGYKTRRDCALKEDAECRCKLLKYAFTYLNEIDQTFPCHLTKAQVSALCTELERADQFEPIFSLLDADGTNLVSEEEFCEFVDKLKLDLKHIERTYIERRLGDDLAQSRFLQRVRALVQQERLDAPVSLLLVIGAALNVVETWPWITGAEDRPGFSEFAEVLNVGLTVVFLLEMFAKLAFLGWHRYLIRASNRFDALVTLSSVCAYIYILLPNGYHSMGILRVSVSFRLFRISRLIGRIPAFREICRSLLSVMPGIRRSAPIMFSMFTMFAILGCDLFGGLITTDPGNDASKLLQNASLTSFGEDDLYGLNFNDRVSAVATLFILLLMGMDSYIDAYTLVAGSYATFYFFAWWIIGILAAFSLTTAIIIDAWGGLGTGSHGSLERAWTRVKRCEGNEWLVRRDDGTELSDLGSQVPSRAEGVAA